MTIKEQIWLTLISLKSREPEAQVAMMQDQVLLYGGTWIEPDPTSYWGPHLYQLELFGVSATGGSAWQVVRNWMRAARPIAQQLDDEASKDRLTCQVVEAADLIFAARKVDREEIVKACDLVLAHPHLVPDRRILQIAPQILEAQRAAAAA